jgi:hypothetical protein
MRLRQLQINIGTADGPYGTTVPFPDGLVVIWADNSMGKSTCARAILVALGMEAMLTTSQQELPLPLAMTAKLDGGALEHAVLESEIWLEIENLNGKRVTVQRTVKGSRDKNLITVHDGPALTKPGAYPTADYFVNRPGGATRPFGFHSFLATFFGWELPAVQTYEGNEVPLYLQCILPFMMTEQTRGWSSIQPPVPTQFRIREVHKRVVEFLLDMDAHKIALARQELQLRKTRLETKWATQVRQLRDIATAAGGVVHELPGQPTSVWPPQVPPSINVPEQKRWIELSERIRQRLEKKDALEAKSIPQVSDAAESVKGELLAAESAVVNQQGSLSRLLDALASEEQEVARLQERLAAIKEDIQRNKDARTLRNLGSRKDSALDHGTCPVCHQHVADSLVPLAPGQAVMSLDENIEFLQEQGRTFEGVLDQSMRVVSARRLQVQAARAEIGQLRERVRHLRQTLVSDGRSPSVAAVYERVELERDLKQDIRFRDSFFDSVAGFESLASDWRDLQKAIVELPKDDLSANDHRKLELWGSSIRMQLKEYGFRSVPWSEISLSPFTYRPEIEGFELQTTISASDLIRTIWAYQSGILEVAREAATNHPGMLVFDEPRQQSTRDVSFVALLRRASLASKFGQQIIFFTSEDKARLKEHLVDLEHSLLEIDGRVIKSLPRISQ